MVPQLTLYAGYEQTHAIAQHRSITHEQVWQLAYNDAMSSVAYLYFEHQMQRHLNRLQNPTSLS